MAALRIVRETIEIDPIRIRKAREWSGVSGRALGAALGLHLNYISRLERGTIEEVDDVLLERIAAEIAGKGALAKFSTEDVLAYLLGEVEWESEIRPSRLSNLYSENGPFDQAFRALAVA